MTAKDESLSNNKIMQKRPLPLQRGIMVLLGLGILLIMAFYTLTDVAHLTHSHVLNGADWMGYALCHRITARSFTIAGRQFPLCARCTGMYLGVFVVYLLLWGNGRLRRGGMPPPLILVLLMGFVALMGIDGINSYLHFFPNAPHLYEPRNWLRLLTGMGTGLMMGITILPALTQTLWRQVSYQPIIASCRELAGVMLVALFFALSLLSNQDAINYVLALASTIGLLLIVLSLNVVFLLIAFRRESRAENWRQLILPLTVGLILTITELSIISALRFNWSGTMAGLPGM
ncbi:MAG: hypothetical protein CSA11_07905 [Chloroflexi bacterium]|nr:MAG: hypothetical protein CSB13_10380 [Chloroflexota bacterium]PIE80516.1 MAG: hypothetical protein CSA11_07905 [Chloroflexota bacterium]